MELRKIISDTIRKFLNEQMLKEFSDKVKFKTSGDPIIDKEDLRQKLEIINKYFKFNSVGGYYDTEKGVSLVFDNGNEIKGEFGEEPFIVDFIIEGNKYTLDIHPYDSLGGLSIENFEAQIKNILNESNTISIVIEHEGYAASVLKINKNNLEDYGIFIVNGTQIEGKQLGETINGTRGFKEK